MKYRPFGHCLAQAMKRTGTGGRLGPATGPDSRWESGHQALDPGRRWRLAQGPPRGVTRRWTVRVCPPGSGASGSLWMPSGRQVQMGSLAGAAHLL